ncbi:hypothetical protein RB595_004180 [Gaeumannomyces hyphopodioides]
MAKIYAKANRVIVWLADPPDNGDQADYGDQALEAIRTAAEQRVDSQLDETKQQVILSLLRQKWFQRVWVLQEVAAARHILIKYGSTEIDGYAFCSGLNVLKLLDKAPPDLQALIPPIAQLIRGAVFRRRHEKDDTSRPARFSLNIRPLGELVDMYHTRKATVPLDKVYALLGMSSDDPAAKIEVNYKAPWKDLFRKLINFSLSDQMSISTWEQKEVAVIEAKGCVLGEVSSAGNDANQDGQQVEITWKTALDLSDRKKQQSSHFALQPSAKAIEKGDIVCLLQGASKPTIIRPCDGFSTIIRIAGPATDCLPKWPDLKTALPTDLLLIWDWDESKGKSQGGKGYEHLVSSRRVPKCPNTECQCQNHLDKAARLWNFGILLSKVWRYDEAVNFLRKAVEVYGTGAALRNGDSPHADHGPWEEADERVLGMMDDLLIDDNGAVKAKDKSDLASLSRAISNGREAVIQLLLDTGKADIESEDKKYGQTPLLSVISNGGEAAVKLMLDTGKIDLESKDERYGQTPLSRAAENGHEAIVKLLLDISKIDFESKDRSWPAPLLKAAENGHEAVVKLLLGTGRIDFESKRGSQPTPLSKAAENGHEIVVKLLLGTGKINVDSCDTYGETPLSKAAMNGHETVVKLLLGTGKVNVDSCDTYGETPLSKAAMNGHETVVKLLLGTGKVDVDSKNRSGGTPLLWAAKNGHEAIVKLLLGTGKVDIDSKDRRWSVPLLAAAENGHEAIVKLLLDTGKIDFESKDRSWPTPLSKAAENGHEAVVKLLLDTGKIDVDLKSDSGETPLSKAVKNGHETVVKLLLGTGKIDVNLKNYYFEETPLLWAAINGHEAVVKLLLGTGKVDVDSKNRSGETPLSWAARNGHEAIVELLSKDEDELVAELFE